MRTTLTNLNITIPDIPPNARLITIFGPVPESPLYRYNENICIFADNKWQSLYPINILRRTAVHLFNRPPHVPLFHFGGGHAESALPGFQIETFGAITGAMWDAASYSIVGVARLTPTGLDYVKAEESLGNVIGLSWNPKVDRHFLPNGKSVITKITEIASVDVHYAPASGARFGLLPPRPSPVFRSRETATKQNLAARLLEALR